MRITTQMLNETARKAGLPINRSSLLDYVNGSGTESENTLLGALSKKDNQSDKTSASSKLFQKDTYDKLEKTASGLASAAQVFLAEDKDSVYAKAEESGSNDILYESIEKLVENYNKTADSLKKASGSLNDYYYHMLASAAESESSGLGALGISFKNGKLSVDEEKLKAASVEDMKKVFGPDSTFLTKVAFLAGRTADNAKSTSQSISSQYNSQGSIYSSSQNRYDFWG
ncbi:MAG: hypothetical protein HFI75_11670 [Lachnospiraceae bacterium]|nr:hypothetical protein [Lachnospiraceae bacterium]